jgi:large subunit ribosomal protein L10
MPRAEKEERVRGIAQRLTSAQATVLTDYRGLTVQDAAELRAALGQADTRFSIVKNSLTRLAVKEAGLEGLEQYVDGPTAIAFILGDPVTAAKALVEQARRLPALEIRGGFAEGRILGADEIQALAKLESRDAMLAKIAGLGKLQMGRTGWMLQALQSKFVSLLEALREKLPEAQAREEPDAEEAPGKEEEQEAPDQATPDDPTAEPAEPSEEAESEGSPVEDKTEEGGS